MENIKHQIKYFIQQNFLFAQTAELCESDSFLDSGIIDSTGILELVAFLGETYGIIVTDEEMVPENLDSIDKVSAYVRRKLNLSELPIEDVPMLASNGKP